MKTLCLSLLFLTLFLPAAVCEETQLLRDNSAPGWSYDQTEFRNELSLVSRKAVRLGQGRVSRFKNINDSYQLTAEAVLILADQGDVEGAIPLLREASRKYDRNRLSYLLLGSALERVGEPEEAAQAYAEFYQNSLTLAPEENELMSPSSLQIFRGYVEARFAAWGIPLPEPKIGLNLRKIRSLAMLEGSPVGQRINMILPMVVVAGFFIFILLRFMGAEFPASVSYFLTSFYVLCVLGYVLWLAHLFAGMPFFVSPGTEYKLFFTGGTVLIIANYVIRRFLASKIKTKIEGAKHCPYCNTIMLNLEIECPKCKRRITR